MSEAAANSAPGARPLRTRLAGLRRRHWLLILAALVLAVIALLGGFDRVDVVTRIQAGQEFDDGALRITVRQATLRTALKAGDQISARAVPGTQLLAVVATLTNNGHTPVPLTGEIELHHPTPLGAATVYRRTDGSATASLGPGLTEDVTVAWPVAATDIGPGDTVTLRIGRKTPQDDAPAGATPGWEASTSDYAELQLPAARP